MSTINTPTFSQFLKILRTKYVQNSQTRLYQAPYPTRYNNRIANQLKRLVEDIQIALGRLEYHRKTNPDHQARRYVSKAKFYSSETLKKKRRISLEVIFNGIEVLILKSVQPIQGGSQKNYPALVVDKNKSLDNFLVVNWSKSIPDVSPEIVSRKIKWHTHFSGTLGFQPLISVQEILLKNDVKSSSTITPYAPSDLNSFTYSYGPRKNNDADAIVKWIKTLVRIMHTLHKNDVRHADIKPEHFLVTITGELQLIDYEYMMTTEEERRSTDKWKGTPRYLPKEYVTGLQRLALTETRDDVTPEQKQWLKHIDAETFISTKCDIWAAGMTLYAILTGKLPHRFEDNTLECCIKTYRVNGMMQFYISQALDKFSYENPIVLLLSKMLTESRLDRWNGSQCYYYLKDISDLELRDAVKQFLFDLYKEEERKSKKATGTTPIAYIF